MKPIPPPLVLAGLMLLLPLTAYAELDLDRLQELVESGQTEEAFELASQHRDAEEGNPRFDLYYGLAAVDTGHPEEGVFALERVLMRRSGLDRVRLELARGYFLLGEDQRAREEFRTVLAHDPPESVQANVQRYLDAIRRRADRYRTVLTAYAELAGGYDSNINSATDAESVAIFDGALALQINRDSREQDDGFFQFGAGGQVERPLGPRLGLLAGIDLSRRSHTSSNDFDTGRVRGWAGWRWREEPLRIRWTAHAQRFFLETQPYQDSYGTKLDARYRLSDRTAGTAFAQYDRLNFADQPIRDSHLWTIGVGLNRVFPQTALRPTLSATVFGGQELADSGSQRAEAVAERGLYGTQAAVRIVPFPEIQFRLGAQFRRSEYGAEHQLFLKTRKENYYQLDAGLTWHFARHWSVGPRVRWGRNEANIELFDYTRTQVWMRLGYEHF